MLSLASAFSSSCRRQQQQHRPRRAVPKTVVLDSKGKRRRYRQGDLIYDINHNYIRLTDPEEVLATEFLAEEARHDGRVNITVEKHLHKWNNVSARKHFVLVSNENATTYSRNSKEPKTIKEALI